jgi:hypothetical protein
MIVSKRGYRILSSLNHRRACLPDSQKSGDYSVSPTGDVCLFPAFFTGKTEIAADFAELASVTDFHFGIGQCLKDCLEGAIGFCLV